MHISDALQHLGVPVWGSEDKHGRSGWVQTWCPTCNTDKGNSHHLGINLAAAYANCWRCGRVNIAWVLSQLSHKPYAYIKDILKDVTGVVGVLPTTGGRFKPLPGAGQYGPAHATYLTSRGFDAPRVAALWDLGGTALTARLPWRLFIPVFRDGVPVTWTTRAIGDVGLRYAAATPEEETVPIKDTIYGEDLCRSSIVVHEGPVDVWRTGPGAGCTYGIDFTAAQVARLSRFRRRVICFDNEPLAQAKAIELAHALSVFPGETHNVVLSGKDAAVAPEEEILKLRKTFLDDGW